MKSDFTDEMTRRTALKLGGAGSFALAGGAQAVALAGTAQAAVAGRWRRRAYKLLVGQRFRVAGTNTRLRLTAVTDLNHRQRGRDDAFALVFRHTHGARISIQRGIPLRHAALGTFPLLLTATGTAHTYIAVINRSHG
jgi:hypothetical protein